MKIGIVGNAGDKFTTLGKREAFRIIHDLLDSASVLVSGGCHLGGVDIWAEESATLRGIPVDIKLPARRSWEGGYKQRNIEIAKTSDEVHVIVADKLPPDYKGMRFSLCYHCVRMGHTADNHVKSGACWTAEYAIKLGKPAFWHIVRNYEEKG